MKRYPPIPETLGDLVLLGQMGYEIPYGDGRPLYIDKPSKIKRALESVKSKIKSLFKS